MFGAEPMTVPHSGIQYAQPSSWKEPGGSLRFAASACVVMPIAAQTIAVIAIIRAILMLSPRGWRPASGGLTNKTGRIDVAQPDHYTSSGSSYLLASLPADDPVLTPWVRFVRRMSSKAEI
jgi:hypothetical protein